MTEETTVAEEELITQQTAHTQKNHPVLFTLKIIAGLVVALLMFGSIGIWYVIQQNQPGVDFPVNEPITIENGTGVRAITEQLAAQNVVQSAQLLYMALIFNHDPADIKASAYIFEEPLSTQQIAQRLTEGDFDTNLTRFTHFEGERVSAVALRAEETLPNFNRTRFLENTIGLEGRLFPDTYFVPLDFTDEGLLELMLNTYTQRMEPYQESIAQHSLSEAEIIILASIIEREANTPESMKLVAGILQNRLDINMPLQADASIEYVIETPLGELPPGQLASELRELDSPYNTYLYTGLPPTPIGNPGMDAITAVLEPTPSEYFYYLTSDDLIFYYAETYDEHLRNIERYLR